MSTTTLLILIMLFCCSSAVVATGTGPLSPSSNHGVARNVLKARHTLAQVL